MNPLPVISVAPTLRFEDAVRGSVLVGFKGIGFVLIYPPVLFTVVPKGVAIAFLEQNVRAKGLIASPDECVLPRRPIVKVAND